MPNKMRFWAYPEPAVLVAFTLLAGQAPLPEPVTDLETELGKAVYDQLKEKGEIVEGLTPLRQSEADREGDFSGGPDGGELRQAAGAAGQAAALP